MRFVLPLVLFAAGCHHEGRCDDCGGPMIETWSACGPKLTTNCEVRRKIIYNGRAAGYETAVFRGSTIHSTLHVVENGRGPHVDMTFDLAADATITSFTATGHHTMNTKVEERFARAPTHATWASEEEHGERDVSGPALYYPQADNLELDGLVVRAALAHGGTIALLPGGEARVEKFADATVTASGEARALAGYRITGLGFAPQYTWMTAADGAWFGDVDHNYSEVPEGWETAAAALVAVQDADKHARDAKIVHDLAHHFAHGVAYTHARVLDVVRGTWIADQTVLVVGDKITAVGGAPGPGMEVIDLHGKAIIPGLVDMHAHTSDADGMLDLASGVTTARDVGNDPDELDARKQRWDSGAAAGPHLFRMGFVEGRNEKAASSVVTAETPEEARAAVKFFADRHYDGMKIYNSIRAELIPIIAKEAHARGMTVTGHIPVHVLAHEAVEAGYDGIEHVNMLFLNFLATHDTDTRDTTRFTLVGEGAPGLDLASAPVTAFLDLLAAHKTVIDPTLGAFEDLFVGEAGKLTPGLASTVSRMPVTVQRSYLANGLGDMTPEKHAKYLAAWKQMLAMVALVHARGIPEVAGTDTVAGLGLLHEIALIVSAGISPADAIRMATLDSAKALGSAATTGTIEAGKIADLVIIDGDPLANIADLERVVTTLAAGVAYDSAALYATVGVQSAVR